MPKYKIIAFLLALLTQPAVVEPSEIFADDISPGQLKFFETKIRPVLIKECYGCHSNQSGNVRGGLRLDTRELTLIGGSSGPAIVPGDADGSLLLSAIEYEDFEMPPKHQLSPEVIDDFRRWIVTGAADPRTSNVKEISSSLTEEDIAAARETFWAYRPPIMPEPPIVQDADWPITQIDRFVLARLEANDLSPADAASPHTVLRRLCYDLVGLPPTREQVDYFSAAWKRGPQAAVEMVVDKLLASQQYGERWGRHWLDVARYAESTGREVNMTYPHAWRYRDYVIDSFNEDKPFDRFVQQQIAGDLLPVETDEQWAENLIATTFLAMGPKNVNEQNRAQFAADLIDEQIDATTRVFLGMSVSCARCHDHKFDAIGQQDYYAVAGLFRSATTYFGNPPSEFGQFSFPQRKRSSSLILLPVDDPNPYDRQYSAQEIEELRQEIRDTLASAANNRRASAADGGAGQSQRARIMLANRLVSLSDRLAVVDAEGNPLSYCMGVQDNLPPQDVPLLVRGEIDQAAQTIKRGLPRVLSDSPLQIPASASGRLQLARFIGSAQSPLTARVMVNRIWQHLLGSGIVSSTENFGVTGQPPSHPELLDYLAVRFIESGWSVKSLVRDIATSKIYRVSSAFNEAAHRHDPDNRLLWRARPRRQDAEALRDAMLSISGSIDLQRPRGSEVAKAGYMRVRNGLLGDPREAVRKELEANRPAMREAMRARRLQSRRSGSSGRADSRSARNFRGVQPIGVRNNGAGPNVLADIARSVTHQLDMENAEFRSVYLPIVRNEVPRSLEVFDFADASAIVGQRETSNTPNQGLYMLNNPFVIRQAEQLAKRIVAESSNLGDQIESIFALVYGRPPTAQERVLSSDYLRSQTDSGRYRSQMPNLDGFTNFCQSLFASAEFRYID